jgi:hypothetical protein
MARSEQAARAHGRNDAGKIRLDRLDDQEIARLELTNLLHDMKKPARRGGLIN